MADQHFIIDMTKPHGAATAKLIRKCYDVLQASAELKGIADEVTVGGTDTDNADFLALFGLPSATAGDSLYPLLQSLMAGTVTQASIAEFHQGI